jgi:signal transduction histidine kinase
LISDGGGVTIRVVDRGRGFDAASRPPGFGLRRSLTERMVACGGAVHMSSAPQMGTCVDLTWPKRST